MKRLQIRLLARSLIDEYSEEPEGLFKDDDVDEIDMNEFINLAQQKVELDLLPFVPHLFRKPFLISTTATKRIYDIVSDLSVTDFLAMEDIYRNKAGERPTVLHFVEQDQLWEFVKVGDTGPAKVWSWEERLKIAIDPTPDVSESDIFKAVYSFKAPNLNHDSTDNPPTDYATPLLPEVSHVLIAIDTAIQCHLVGEEESSDLQGRYDKKFKSVIKSIASLPGAYSAPRPAARERIE